MLKSISKDIKAIFERDPAARNILEIAITYPGFHALLSHRVAHCLHSRLKLRLIARLISHISRLFTGVEIHPGAEIAPGVFIDHGMGVVIGETANVGENVTLYQGVTLGGTGKERGKRHPTLEDGVVVGAGAKVLGNIIIGANSRVGAGSVVVDPVPPNSTVVGVPGHVVRREGERVASVSLDHRDLIDPVEEMLEKLEQRIERLEAQLAQVLDEQ